MMQEIEHTHTNTHTCSRAYAYSHYAPGAYRRKRAAGDGRKLTAKSERQNQARRRWGWSTLLPAILVLALVPSAADSQGQIEWLEQSNRALERDLASARAELLLQTTRGRGDGREGPTPDEGEEMRRQLAEMHQEVDRLSAINKELKSLLGAGDPGGGTVPLASELAMADAASDAVAREELHTKVVGSAPKSKDDEMFLLDLAAAKLTEGDLGTAAGLYRSHLALFTGTEAGRAGAARRMRLFLMEGLTRSRAGRHLATEMVLDRSSAQVLLDIASELEKGGLLAENRRAASGLLELYLSHHSSAADVWHRLGRLRWRDERLAEAVHCYQVASNLEPLHKEYAASYAAASDNLMSQPWPPPRQAVVYLLQSTASNAGEASALAELQKALIAAGVDAVLVTAPARSGKTSKRNKAKGVSSRDGPPVPAGDRGQEAGYAEGGNVTLSLPVAHLQAGDIVVFPASRPPPSQWMHAARLRHVLLLSWLFSWRDLVGEGASSGIDAPPHPLWMDWDAGMVAHMMEGDSVKAVGSSSAAHVWTYRAAASHSVLWRSSAPPGALLIPPLPSLPHGVDPDRRFELMPRGRDEHDFSRDSHKHDLILCRGTRRKCLSALHETLRALPGSGFCPVPLATIIDVVAGSPAHDAGLAAGDLVLAAGLVASGLRDVEQQAQALESEIRHAKDHILRLTVRRLHRAAIVSLDVTPQSWPGDGLLGWNLEFNSVFECPDDDVHLFSARTPHSNHSRPRPLKIVYAPEDLSSAHMRSLLIAAKVLLRQFSWEGGEGDSLGAVELEAALYDVCMLVPSDAAAAVDWPIASRLILDPHVSKDKVSTMLLETLQDYETLSAERGVLKEYIKSLPAALSTASRLMVESAQHLFYTVALDVRDEAAACSFILSARLSHPLATVEVLVRDVQAFYHTHAALVLQLKERGLWNGVWLSQIPPTALDDASAGASEASLGDAWRLQVSLLSRPLSLHAGRSYHMACLVDPHLVMVPRAPHGLLDKLSGYSWSSAPYMAWAHKGVMRLPLCFRPSAMHAKLTRATLSPPAGAELTGKYLYRAMLGVAGFAIHKRLGDTNEILSLLGVMLPSSSGAQDLAPLTAEQSQQLQALVSHPSWAAAQAFLSVERKAVVRRALESARDLDADVRERDEQHGVDKGSSGAMPDEKSEQLEQEVRDLRQRVSMLQQKLSEAKQLEQGWQEVAIATERQLVEARKGEAGGQEQPAGRQNVDVEVEPESHMRPSMPRSTFHSDKDYEGVADDARPAALANTRVRLPNEVSEGGEARAEGTWMREEAEEVVAESHEAGVSEKTTKDAEAAVLSTKIVMVSGRTTSRADAGAPDLPLTPSDRTLDRATQPARRERQQEAELEPRPRPLGHVRHDNDASDGALSVARTPNSSQTAALENSTREEAAACQPNGLAEEVCQANTGSTAGNSAGGSAQEGQPRVPADEPYPAAEPELSLPEESHAPSMAHELLQLPENVGAGHGVVALQQDGEQVGGVVGGLPADERNITEAVEGIGIEKAEGAGEGCGQGAAVAAGCDEGSSPLSAEERTLQAAIHRLAQEDAEEELRLERERVRGRVQAPDGAGDELQDASGGEPSENTPLETCPAGYVCSDSAPVRVAANRESLLGESPDVAPSSDVPAAPQTDDGRSLPRPKPREADWRVQAIARSGEHTQGADRLHRETLSAEEEEEETIGDLAGSMLWSHAAAQQRAEVLKEARRMLTTQNKMDDVAKRDEEIVRSRQEHPMFQRAIAAAEAAKQPHPTTAPQAKSYSPAPDADRGGAAFETEAAGGADRAPSQGSVLQGEVEHHVTGGRLEPVPAAGRDLTAERPAPGRGTGVAECGVGIGVGAAAHGTWKIKRVVAGGSVDRAVGGGSATRPLQEGDILTRVDGSSLSGMSIADLSSLVKGPHGSRVVLEFYSALDSSLHTLTVDRVCE